jgi:hypothetical protein
MFDGAGSPTKGVGISMELASSGYSWSIHDNMFLLVPETSVLLTDLCYSSIGSNRFLDCNYGNNYGIDILLTAYSASGCVGNSIFANTHRNTHATTGKTAAIVEYDATYDPNYNEFFGNVISGSGYSTTAVVVTGAQSRADHNMAA